MSAIMKRPASAKVGGACKRPAAAKSGNIQKRPSGAPGTRVCEQPESVRELELQEFSHMIANMQPMSDADLGFKPFVRKATSAFAFNQHNWDMAQYEFVCKAGGICIFDFDKGLPAIADPKPSRWHRAIWHLCVGDYDEEDSRSDGVSQGEILSAKFDHWMPPACFKLMKKGKLPSSYFDP